jgi:outer membrane protein assembly factor BamB
MRRRDGAIRFAWRRSQRALTPRRAPPFFFTVASTKTFKEKGIPMRVASFASFAVMLLGASLSNPFHPVTAQSKASAGTASPARKIVNHEDQDIMTKPNVAWRFRPQDGEVFGTPAVADGVVCITWANFERGTALSGKLNNPNSEGGISLVEKIPSGVLYGLDARTGKVRWTYALDRVIANPVVANGVVYVSTYHLKDYQNQPPRDREIKNSHVRAIDLQTGKELWRYRIFGDTAPQVAPLENVVLFVADGRSVRKKLYTLDAKTGEEKWQRAFRSYFYYYGEPAQVRFLYGNDGKCYMADGDVMYALDIQTGEVRWETKLVASDGALTNRIQAIRMHDGKIYAMGKLFRQSYNHPVGQNLYSVDAQTGRLHFTKEIPKEDDLYFVNSAGIGLYDFKLISESQSPPRYETSLLFLTLDAERERWRVPLSGVIRLITGKTLLYAATDDYNVSARDESGKEIWAYPFQDAIDRITMKDGAMYVLSDGTVYALQ